MQQGHGDTYMCTLPSPEALCSSSGRGSSQLWCGATFTAVKEELVQGQAVVLGSANASLVQQQRAVLLGVYMVRGVAENCIH